MAYSMDMTTPNTSASDIRTDSWVEWLAPSIMRPYLRLARVDRPIGTWLLLLPCWWSVALATGGWPDFTLMAQFAIGAFVMRGAGCTINDIVDRNFDAKVARTVLRPIANGDITVRQALLFLMLQLSIGMMVVSQFNPYAMLLAISSLGLVVLYPFAKRFTYWPQLVLGLTFNWGALVGWAAVRGELGWPAVALYVGGVFWTLGYDTIYAHQDKEDDVLIGVKSSALALGDKTQAGLFIFYGATVLSFGLSGYLIDAQIYFYAGLAICAAHLIRQAVTVDISNPPACLAMFKSNRNFGIGILAVIIFNALVL
jgi:4-hydroxybenzoate polyprenyltransferase